MTRKPLNKKNSQSGFSLIGVVITLAVVAMLASAILPTTIKSMMLNTRASEATVLASFGKTLRDHAMSTQVIPSSTGWIAAIASYASMAPSKVQVSPSGINRIYVYPSNFTAIGSTLIYDQAANAALGTFQLAKPTDARVLIIETIGKTTLTTPSGVLTSFDAVWDQTGTFPAELTESDSLIIERVNFSDLFVPVTLTNNDAVLSAKWGLGASPIQAIVAGSSITVYAISGTQLKLYDKTNALYYTHTVASPVSFGFNAIWGGTLASSNNAIGSVFNSNGLLTNWALNPSCAPTGTNYLLTVDLNAAADDYYVYAGIGGVATFMGKAKQGQSQNYSIGECDLVAVTPKNGTINIYIFYMPHAPKTMVLP